MSRKIILIKQELLLLVYELNRSGLLAENEKIRPILAQLEKILLCDLSPSTKDSIRTCRARCGGVASYGWHVRQGLVSICVTFCSWCRFSCCPFTRAWMPM